MKILSRSISILVFVFFHQVFAETSGVNQDNEGSADGLVEIEYAPEVLAPYAQRRPDFQWTFNFQMENYLPGNLKLATGDTYTTQFSSKSFMLSSVSVGGKYNLGPVGVEAALGYGAGGSSSLREGQISSTGVNIVKKFGRLTLELDRIFEEPYVAPYGSLLLTAFDYAESTPTTSAQYSNPASIGFQAGLLIQLNWLEEKAALAALQDTGLQNTFIDLFVHKYTSAGADKDLSSVVSWGAGFKTEY